MRLLALAVMSLMWVIALPATVYKWVDENGVTHYSDQPHPGAKRVEVEAVQTYSAPPPPVSQPAAAPVAVIQGPVYKVCELYRPTADEVLFNVDTVTAKLRVDPQMRAGDKVIIALDGKRLTDVSSAGEEFTVTPVFRGTHTISAEVVDPQGKTICQTSGITFHVRQASKSSPQSPTRPVTPPPRTPRPPTRP
jgi:hypothetical protein